MNLQTVSEQLEPITNTFRDKLAVEEYIRMKIYLSIGWANGLAKIRYVPSTRLAGGVYSEIDAGSWCPLIENIRFYVDDYVFR